MTEKIKKIRCVIFDLDGTLLSTLDTITYHLNFALRQYGLTEISVADTAAFIGNGARKLVMRAIGKNHERTDALVSSVLLKYNSAYDSDPLPLTFPYEGISELVDELVCRGITLGVITNKPEPTAKKLVEHFFGGKF